MPAGTLTLTNNSAVVKGTGTAFNTELKVGDFIVSVVGGVAYTLPVKTIDSATQATLIKAYDGPTQAGAAWYAVPRDAMNTITAQLAAETAKALRGLNLDKNNWQQVFSGTGNITVKLPDGSEFTGPAWNSYAGQLLSLQSDINIVAKTADGKLAKDKNLSDLASASAARGNLQLGADSVVWFSGLELSSATPFIDFHYAKSTEDYSVRLICDVAGKLTCSHQFRAKAFGCKQGVNGDYSSNQFNFNWNASSQLEAWVDSTLVGGVTLFAINSDKGLKKDIIYRNDSDSAYEQVSQWRVAAFKYKERGIIPESDEMLGFIANDLVQHSPECVQGEGLPEDYDVATDPNNPNAYYLNQTAMIAKLTQALQVAIKKISKLEMDIEFLNNMK